MGRVNRRKKKYLAGPQALPPVIAHAVVETGGVRETRTVDLFDKPPGWWHQARENQRLEWLTGYFRRALNLTATQILVSVRCGTKGTE